MVIAPTKVSPSLTCLSLKKGAKVELWVQCKPFTVEDGDVQKVETQAILCSIHQTLIQHFSGKWKRELTGNTAKRVHVPFSKEPVRLVVAWMTGGGGEKLGTPEFPYPKFDLSKLGILQNVATFLEIDPLVELITKDIVAATPVLPAPKTKKPPVVTCYYCRKTGLVRKINAFLYSSDHETRHVEKDCADKLCYFCNKQG